MNAVIRCMLVGALSLMMGLSSADVAPAGLVGYWRFDDNTQDSSGKGNHGTATHLSYSTNVPAAIGSGKSGSFDNTAYVTIAADETLDSDVFTLAYWITQNGIAQNGNYDRVTSRESNSFETAVGNDLWYYKSSTGQPYGWRDTGHDVPSTGWEHIAFVVSDDAPNNRKMEVYVNGNRIYVGDIVSEPSGIMQIGARCSPSAAEFFQGLIDEVVLFDEALSASSIQSLASGVDAWAIVPEPNAFVLLSMGSCLGMLGVRWARRRRPSGGGAGGNSNP